MAAAHDEATPVIDLGSASMPSFHQAPPPLWKTNRHPKTVFVQHVDQPTFEQDITVVKTVTLSRSKPFRSSITVTEAEVFDPDVEDDNTSTSSSLTLFQELSSNDIVRERFESSKSQWVDDPVIRQWRQSDHQIHNVISNLESLHREWQSTKTSPFSPITDSTWLHTGRVLADVGLPWHNNQINMPDEIDTSWPFHFKAFEVQVIRAKGSRVGDPNPSGYVCNWVEANCYGIRALQQELREKCPNQKPLLVYQYIEIDIVKSAEKLFGLESYRTNLFRDSADLLRDLNRVSRYGQRPIIFAATLGNSCGQYDDLDSICMVSETLPLILHLDTSRSFDYITTLDDDQRQSLGIEKLTLGLTNLGQCLRLADGTILASTIIAGGSNYTSPAPVVALKPLALGSTPTQVAYTRASDSTLAGSRDALAPLWVALQEERFGRSGFNEIYKHCANMRQVLVCGLQERGVSFEAPVYTLDVVIENCSEFQTQQLISMGAVITQGGNVLLAIQPGVRLADVEFVLRQFHYPPLPASERTWSLSETDFASAFPIAQSTVDELEATVQSWKVATRSAAGYPFHMGSYSALGPIIGLFLDVKIPEPWIQARAAEVLDLRLKSFGLVDLRDRASFKGAFTNGSTMGNRVGIHTALTHFPGAFLYFSSETHYSVPKTARDCDALTNRWSDRIQRYSEIAGDNNGSICIESLVRQALVDRDECRRHGEVYQMILFLNMGTTFVGARDDIARIRRSLAEVDIQISYVHMDGALDFGFHECGVALGPPGMAEINGVPVVQGVTLSHHKAMGNMVSGEVLCYSPGAQLATLGSGVDPRAVFETWLYLQIYSEADLIQMFEYCQKNAADLDSSLNEIGVITKRNPGSPIVVLERPPAWITEEFSLRPEADWVHFITMPHVSRETVDLFVHRIAWVDQQCQTAFDYVTPLLNTVMKQSLTLKRVQCRSILAAKVRALAQSLVQPTEWYFESVDSAIKASLRGAMSVVATDQRGEIQAVFLAESTRERKILAGPVLVRSRFSGSKRMILDVARQLVGFMARHLDARVEADDMSYMFLPLE